MGLPRPRLDRGLPVRWNRRKDEYAYYLTCLPGERVDLARQIRIAGLRWPIETGLQDAKGWFGLDEHQMRKWTSLRHWITLCLLAATAVTIAHARAQGGGSRLNLTGLARPYGELTRAQYDDEFLYTWSEWICDHNEQAQASHCHRRDDYCPS